MEELGLEGAVIPPLLSNVDAPLNPGELRPFNLDKVESIGMIKIKVEHDSAIAISATTSENFI
tara:strand:+ start:112 stop:300 length:189 start_codon:yes stop_codon:yes gene_type:complete